MLLEVFHLQNQQVLTTGNGNAENHFMQQHYSTTMEKEPVHKTRICMDFSRPHEEQ